MIKPGLERISHLLKGVDFPWKAIHVAGTNGKGSVCHIASNLLTRRNLKCGRFTSPHLVDRWDGIRIDGEPVNEGLFRKVEAHYTQLSEREGISASPFEILTATAFTIFNEQKVEVGVVEVGMGGELDATNILNNQGVCVITKIARDHQAYLGNTLEEIARHKAGILRPNVPYIVNPFNDLSVQLTIKEHAQKIGAGKPLEIDTLERRENLFSRKLWHSFAQPLASFQRDNAVLGILAAQEVMRGLGGKLTDAKVLKKLQWLENQPNFGRQAWLRVEPTFGVPGKLILVDGAHNPDAANALKQLVPRIRLRGGRRERVKDLGTLEPRGITWVVAMKADKQATGFFDSLLCPGDKIVATTFGQVDGMPSVKPMDSESLLKIAQNCQSRITGIHMPKPGAVRAIQAASLISGPHDTIVLTGSLYLVGDLYRELRAYSKAGEWTLPEKAELREYYAVVKEEERERFYSILPMLGNKHLEHSRSAWVVKAADSSTSTDPNVTSTLVKGYRSLSETLKSILPVDLFPSSKEKSHQHLQHSLSTDTSQHPRSETDQMRVNQNLQQSEHQLTKVDYGPDKSEGENNIRDSSGKVKPYSPETHLSRSPLRARKM